MFTINKNRGGKLKRSSWVLKRETGNRKAFRAANAFLRFAFHSVQFGLPKIKFSKHLQTQYLHYMFAPVRTLLMQQRLNPKSVSNMKNNLPLPVACCFFLHNSFHQT
jgi:hypothetical protein